MSGKVQKEVERGNIRGKASLRNRIFLGNILLVFLISLLFLISYFLLRNHLLEDARRYSPILSSHIRLEYEHYVQAKKELTSHFSSDGLIRESVRRLNEQPANQTVRMELNQHLKRNKAPLDPDILDILIFSRAGKLVAGTNIEMVKSPQELEKEYFSGGGK